MSAHITAEQKEIMLDFIKVRPKFYAGKFSPDFTMAQSRALWQELANILNAHPNGAKKEWAAWRKTWIDIKKNSKAKVAKQKKYQRGTGWGPPEPANIDSFDTKVMELTSPVCFTGNKEVPEPIIILEEEVLYDGIIPSNNELESMQTEAVQNIKLDPCYMNMTPPPNENNTETITELKKNETTRKKMTPKMHTPLAARGKPRLTKTMRLNESIKNHTKMLEISERTVMETQTYRSEKLQVLKEQRDELRKQTHLMENISVSLNSIAEALQKAM